MLNVNNHYNDIIKFKPVPLIDDKSYLVLKENKIKISNIKNNLSEYEKNPNFYRNKKIIAVAATIVAIAAVAMLTYFCWAVALPVCIATGTAHSSGIMMGGLMISPVYAALGGFFGLTYLFKSLDGDKKSLEKLEAENNVLKDKIRSKIKLCDEHIENSIATTTKQLTEDAWKAMKNISTPDYATILDQIDTNPKKEATWLNNQQEIISFRRKNEFVKQNLEALL